jgi:ribosomal protein RSM22 (predicted rRNA methylase)
VDLATDLRDALEAVLADAPPRAVTAATERLIERYRAGGAASEPILADRWDVLAYAAYRMPATFGAVRSALAQVARAEPDLAPRRYLDVGGGTGAAAWAVADTYPGVEAVTVLDQVPAALALGRRLALQSGQPVLTRAAWQTERTQGLELPGCDLVTVSYVLGELPEADQSSLMRRCADAAGAVLVVEPGTPDGYARVLAARTELIAAGLTVVAPCPHQDACPIVAPDWCHFSARVNRSALHRRVKRAELSYEDEKFSYVAALRTPGGLPREARVLRHPQQRKGLVALRLCTVDDGIRTETVSKRQGERYKAARDVSWGDAWG